MRDLQIKKIVNNKNTQPIINKGSTNHKQKIQDKKNKQASRFTAAVWGFNNPHSSSRTTMITQAYPWFRKKCCYEASNFSRSTKMLILQYCLSPHGQIRPDESVRDHSLVKYLNRR